MSVFSQGIDFSQAPHLFTSLQNRGEGFLRSVTGKLSSRYRFPFVFILTCDRAEIISEEIASAEPLERALSLNPAKVSPFRYREEGIKRVFLLASGLLSPLFGEDTVQGQLLDGLEAARASGCVSPELDKLLLSAVAFSKRMHSTMKVRVFDETIVSEMVSRSEGKVLIVGSGEGARRLAQALRAKCQVTMTLRDTSKDFLVPPGVKAIGYESRREALPDADILISASSGLYHTFEAEDLPLMEGKALYDFSSPPDLPSSFHAIRAENLGIALPEKEAVIKRIESEAEKAVSEYLSWLGRRSEAELIRQKGMRIASETLRRLSGPLSSLSLEPDKEKALRMSILDTVRKAVVQEEMARRS